ncbi:hypothetical protein C1645_802492 [Glomus cerebriforme]|uniref:Uncharacterized protein n=1 Tax=Glomus cerebriforme TaxID=658196 RepID=A0A397TG18_9GLOM|nr:hypothetical protein C1645_802492 [Glomus cerebriforme]
MDIPELEKLGSGKISHSEYQEFENEENIEESDEAETKKCKLETSDIEKVVENDDVAAQLIEGNLQESDMVQTSSERVECIEEDAAQEGNLQESEMSNPLNIVQTSSEIFGSFKLRKVVVYFLAVTVRFDGSSQLE